MTPDLLRVRKADLAQAVFAAKAGVAELMMDFQPGSDGHRALAQANVTLDQVAHRCNVLADALLVYADPEFYRDLPPCRAVDDQGARARGALEMAFPE